MLKFSEIFEFSKEKFRKIPILKEFEWFEWFEWFGPLPIEPFNLGLDHSPLMIAQERGSEGHTLHGGAVTEAGEPAWPLAYEFRHGHMRNQLLTVCIEDTNE